MATIKPFRAVRPKKELAKRIAALPYDVFSEEEARIEVMKEPLSFLGIDSPEIHFEEERKDIPLEQIHAKGKEVYNDFLSKGYFLTEERPSLYLYELTRNQKTQTGIVALTSIKEYEEGIIKKHENTRIDKQQDRFCHIDSLNAQSGPIFMAYRSHPSLQELIRSAKKGSPLYDFVAEDGVLHRVFRIQSLREIDALIQEFQKVDSLYIADGHHRAKAASLVAEDRRKKNPSPTGEEEYEFLFSVLFDAEELTILSCNRVVKDLNKHTKQEFLDLVQQNFSLEIVSDENWEPQQKHEIGMVLDQTWYCLKPKANLLALVENDLTRSLDVSILQNFLLAPVLGIMNPRQDQRIDFIGGIRGKGEVLRRTLLDMQVGFFLYPTAIEDLMELSDAGLLMPPKSTWFEPKLRSGLFIHSLEEDPASV